MRIGSLFSGYGGLDMAVEQVFPSARPAWFCEWDDAPSRILAHHWPDVPNLSDVTLIDWEELVSCKPDIEGTMRMYDLYCQGLSLAQVAKKHGVSRQTVYTRFKRRGLDMRSRPAAKPHIDYNGRRYTLGVNGYYRATEGDRAYLHRAVWEDEVGPIPDGWDVHHVDHDKTNNARTNLHCLSKADHTRLHAAEEVMPNDSFSVDILTGGYPRAVPTIQRRRTARRDQR